MFIVSWNTTQTNMMIFTLRQPISFSSTLIKFSPLSSESLMSTELAGKTSKRSKSLYTAYKNTNYTNYSQIAAWYQETCIKFNSWMSFSLCVWTLKHKTLFSNDHICQKGNKLSKTQQTILTQLANPFFPVLPQICY